MFVLNSSRLAAIADSLCSVDVEYCTSAVAVSVYVSVVLVNANANVNAVLVIGMPLKSDVNSDDR